MRGDLGYDRDATHNAVENDTSSMHTNNNTQLHSHDHGTPLLH